MRIRKCIFFIISITFMFACSDRENFTPKKEKFNSGWYFIRVDDENNLDDHFIKNKDFKSWEEVTLPHTSKIEPKIVNDQWQGISWYKKEFLLSQNHRQKKLFLHFEGAMNIAEVWINGKKLIKHQGGYLPFTIDFSHVAKFDKKIQLQ